MQTRTSNLLKKFSPSKEVSGFIVIRTKFIKAVCISLKYIINNNSNIIMTDYLLHRPKRLCRSLQAH